MVFSTSSKFQSLSVRPPTPPKDLHDKDADEVLDFLADPFGTKEPVAKVPAAKALLNTPQTSPSSESDIPSSALRSSSRKKVNFETQPCAGNVNGILSQSFIPVNSSPLRPLPQTRVSKPLKSILKPSDAASTPPVNEGAPADEPKSVAEMLESIMKQLASQTRPSRFDGYHALQRTMQAYDKMPDTKALVDKTGLLTQFIQRDMLAIGINGTILDSQLVGQALKFLLALVRIPEVRPAMSDEFCNFVVDRIIQVAADATQAKVVINTHLAVLMQQNFRPKIITPTRVERILDVLDTIEERVSGQSVLAYRVRIFRKLIMQRPDVMSQHTERWFKLTLKASLHTQKDINQSALDTIVSAAKAFGNDRQVPKSVLSVLNRVKSDGQTVTHGMVKELHKLLNSDHAAMVPQIWAAVTSLLPGCLDMKHFAACAEWLKVFQTFFHSTKEDVKKYANIAAGSLVYTLQLSESTTHAWSKLLIRIPQAQLETQSGKKTEREAATSAMSAYFALLYHAFGPTASHKQLDRFWLDFVVDFWRPLVNSSPKHALAACRVVSALFNGPRKPCDPQRTLDFRHQAALQLEELPTLDPKWVRKSISHILEFVEALLDAIPWTIEDIKDEPAKTMWLSLLDSLNAASSQEVTVSTHSKDALAHLVNFLRRVWDGHAAELALSQQKEDSWANKFCFLLQTVVRKLGAVRFSDKFLVRNGRDVFEAAATPSHRSRSPRTSPLLYFVDLLANQSEGKLSDSLRKRALKVLIKPCFDAQNTRFNKFELLRECSALIDASTRTPLSDSFWQEISGLTTSCLGPQSLNLQERGSRQLGKEYEMVVEILSLGFPYLATEPSGEQLLSTLADTVRKEAGEGAVVLAVVEKVSESVLKRAGSESTSMPFLSIVLRNLPTSIARPIVEQGRRNLWSSSSNLGRSVDFDPYNHLYDVVVSVGSGAYQGLAANNGPTTGAFLGAFATSVRQCPPSLLVVYLRKTQAMVRLWIEDPQKKLQQNTEWVKAVFTLVLQLWKEVCAAMYKLPRNNGEILVHLGLLMTSGFVSRRRKIVNLSIDTWNATFGKEKSLRYPPQLENALRRLRSIAELSLPGLEGQDGDDDIAPSFYDSDSNTEVSEIRKRTPRGKETPFKIVKSSRQSRSKSRSPMVPSTNTKRTSTGRTPKGRLRHENSQIEFEPIVSSPSNLNNMESQVLTERQREVYERQMLSSNMYTDMGSVSPLPRPVARAPSPLEFHSDADALPISTSRTPLRNVRSLGDMDVFVGSSPTPHARNRSQGAASDRTSVATPTAVRSVQHTDGVDELGSSPPRFERDTQSSIHGSQARSVSYNDGTTMDEDAFLTGTPDEDPDEDLTTELEATDMPSSNLDLQLTAQLDAEIQAQNVTTAKAPKQSRISSKQHPVNPNAGDKAKGGNAVIDLPAVTDSMHSNTETTSTSRVGDSFTSQAAEAESPQIRSVRRSQRHSSAASPRSTNDKKRKPSSGRGPGRPKKNRTEEAKDGSVTTLKGDASDSAPPSPSPSSSTVIVPETTRQRGLRRSASLLNRVENQSQDIVEDTPVPKRARRSIDKDVSEAKQNTPTSSQNLKSQRLKHVQATPKHSDAASSGRSSSGDMEYGAVHQTTSEAEPAAEMTLEVDEQNANVAPQLPDATPTASQAQDNQLQVASTSVATPNRSFAERVILTPRSIINQLKAFKDALFGAPQLALSRQEYREADDLMFDIRRGVYAAGTRGEEPSE